MLVLKHRVSAIASPRSPSPQTPARALSPSATRGPASGKEGDKKTGILSRLKNKIKGEGASGLVEEAVIEEVEDEGQTAVAMLEDLASSEEEEVQEEEEGKESSDSDRENGGDDDDNGDGGGKQEEETPPSGSTALPSASLPPQGSTLTFARGNGGEGSSAVKNRTSGMRASTTKSSRRRPALGDGGRQYVIEASDDEMESPDGEMPNRASSGDSQRELLLPMAPVAEIGVVRNMEKVNASTSTSSNASPSISNIITSAPTARGDEDHVSLMDGKGKDRSKGVGSGDDSYSRQRGSRSQGNALTSEGENAAKESVALNALQESEAESEIGKTHYGKVPKEHIIRTYMDPHSPDKVSSSPLSCTI